MWPPVRPMRCSTSGGPRTSRWTITSATSGAKRLIGRDGEVADLFAPLVPRAMSQFEGHVLREDAHDVTAVGGDRRVIGALEVQLAPGGGRLAPPARLVGGLRGVGPGADGHHGAMGFDVGPRRGEPREPPERAVDLEYRAPARPALHPPSEFDGDAVSHMATVRFGSALDTTARARIISPLSSSHALARVAPPPPAPRRRRQPRLRSPRRPARTTPAPYPRPRSPTPPACRRRCPTRA